MILVVMMSACLLLCASIPGEGLSVVLPHVPGHHSDGWVGGGGGGGGGVPGVAGAVLTGAGCCHHLALFPGGVHEQSPHTVSGHGCVSRLTVTDCDCLTESAEF